MNSSSFSVVCLRPSLKRKLFLEKLDLLQEKRVFLKSLSKFKDAFKEELKKAIIQEEDYVIKCAKKLPYDIEAKDLYHRSFKLLDILRTERNLFIPEKNLYSKTFLARKVVKNVQYRWTVKYVFWYLSNQHDFSSMIIYHVCKFL